MNLSILSFLLTIIFLTINSDVFADCGGPKSHPKEEGFTIENCRIVNPSKENNIMHFNKNYSDSIGKSAETLQHAKKILDSYKGIVIQATNSSGASNPYFYAEHNGNQCRDFKKGQQIKAIVEMACCDGDPNPPCYLGMKEYFMDGSVKNVIKN